MHAARSVTRLATHVDLRECAPIRVRRQVVVLLEICRVALRTHVVPILRRAGPVQRIARLDALVQNVGRRDVKPLFPLGVPRDAQYLHATVGKFDHVLLQRPHTERVLDRKVLHPAVRALGMDEKLALPTEHPRRDALVRELPIVEVAQHRLLGRQVHRPIVVRAGPSVRLLGVTLRTARAADIHRRNTLGQRHPPVGRHRNRGEPNGD